MKESLLQRIRTFITQKRVWIPLLCAICVGGYFLFRTPTVTKNEYTAVVRKTFTTSVQGTGSVSTEQEVTLTALSSGQITSLSVVPGQRVKKGQIIARTDAKDQSIGYEQARNDVSSAQLTLTNSKTNAVLVEKEQNLAVENSLRSLYNAGLALTKVGDYQGVDGPVLSGSYTCTKEGVYTLTSHASNGGISMRFSGIESGGVFLSDIPRPIGECGLFISVPKGVSVAVDGKWDIHIPNKQSSAYISAYNAYQSALQTKEKAVLSAQQTVAINTESVKRAQTSLRSAQQSLADTSVIAPFDGQIGTVSAQLGQQITSGTAIATLITDGKVAEVTLNEVDVAKVSVGQTVQLTFDAIDSLVLAGKVTEIDAIGTATQNVVTFKVRIVFTEDDARVKPGMSVTATIVTKQIDGVLVVPNGVVKKNARGSYVEVRDEQQASKDVTKKIPVTVGDTNDTETYITEGIEEGQQVMVRTITTTGSKTSSQKSSQSSFRVGGPRAQ